MDVCGSLTLRTSCISCVLFSTSEKMLGNNASSLLWELGNWAEYIEEENVEPEEWEESNHFITRKALTTF